MQITMQLPSLTRGPLPGRKSGSREVVETSATTIGSLGSNRQLLGLRHLFL